MDITEHDRAAQTSDIDIRIDVTGFHHGQMDARLVAVRGGTVLGVLDYSVFDGVPLIGMIEVAERKRGVGRSLVRRLQAEYPTVEIRWGVTSEEGEGFRTSLRYREVTDPEVEADMRRRDGLKAVLDEWDAVADRFYADQTEENRAAVNAIDPQVWNAFADEFRELDERLRGVSPTTALVV